MTRIWMSLLLLVAVPALAQHSTDFCQLVQNRAPARAVLTRFVVLGAFPHGFSATSVNCPRTGVHFDFVLGDSPRSQAFERWVYFSPSRLGGIREVQATADFDGDTLRVTRVHAYRELTGKEAASFRPKLSPQEEKAVREAAHEAAKAADEAVRH